MSPAGPHGVHCHSTKENKMNIHDIAKVIDDSDLPSSPSLMLAMAFGSGIDSFTFVEEETKSHYGEGNDLHRVESVTLTLTVSGHGLKKTWIDGISIDPDWTPVQVSMTADQLKESLLINAASEWKRDVSVRKTLTAASVCNVKRNT